LIQGSIYFVEQDDTISDDVCALLTANGYNVVLFRSGEEFLDRWDRSLEGCLLLDIRLPGLSGIELLGRISDSARVLPVIMFTSVMDMQLAVQATKNGVYDYCPKNFAPEVLLAKISEAMRVNGERLSKMSNHVKTIQAIASLTDREREILHFLCEGKSSKKIGQELGISSYTVDNHRARIMSKMGVNSVTKIVQMTLSARNNQGT
jgi:FixJ family two-component response regulator